MKVLLAVAVLLLAVAPGAHAAGRCGDPGQRPWCDTSLDPDERAGLLLDALTRDEKISLLGGDEVTGVAGGPTQHTGTSNGVERVGLPPIYFSDGPVGPRQGQATAMPSPISLASTFSPDVARRHGSIVGDEVRKKGNDVVFAPAVNMQRTPLNGRTFEYFGEDPFLSARLAVGWTKGLQAEGVIGNVKHYAVNNQEGIGATFPGAPVGGALVGSRLTVDARLDERTLREIYLPQFEAAVKEGNVGSVMCSYNRINGQYGCENEHTLERILKRDWGFKGFVLTDYGAGKNTVAALNNGLDLDIFPGVIYRPEAVNAALASGQVSEGTIDEHVRRILRTLFAYGFFDREAYENDDAQIRQLDHHAAVADLEQEGIVLLENDTNALPLDAGQVRKLALIGPEADTLKNGGGSSAIKPYVTTTPKDALVERLGDRVAFDDGADADRAAAVARDASVAVVVVGDSMTEGTDKPCMGLNCGAQDGIDRDALIEKVAAAQPNTIVVLQSGGPVLTPWRDKVRGLLEAWYPGQNGGTAIARVLFGDAEPGGRLPTTFPLREADQPTSGDPEKYPGVAERVQYKEGVLIGYRWFDQNKLGVAYPFGYGLSYTSFALRDLRIEPSGSGGDAVVSVEVANTGTRPGTAVPQLYLGMPEPSRGVVQPPVQLKGFERVTLAPRESRRVSMPLDERAFSYWNTGANGWRVARGCYRVAVGPSSRELPLEGVIGRGQDCGGALSLPLNRRACTSRRVVTIRLPRALQRGARVTYAGRRAQVTRKRGRLRARVNLRGLRGGRVVVRVRGRTRSGRVVRQTRVFRTCAAKRRPAR